MQQKTKVPAVIFITPETQQNAIVVRPPELPVYAPPIQAQVVINTARLIGRPVKAVRVNTEIGLGYGRIYAVEYEAWLDPDPIIPVPLVNYTPRFIWAMQRFVSHQLSWARYGPQTEWYKISEILACRVMAASHRLQLLPGEIEAIRDILWYAIAVPAAKE